MYMNFVGRRKQKMANRVKERYESELKMKEEEIERLKKESGQKFVLDL